MPYKRMKPRFELFNIHNNLPKIVRMTVKLSLGAFSGITLAEVYELCYRYNIKIIKCECLGGFLNKSYRMEIEGREDEIAKMQRVIG